MQGNIMTIGITDYQEMCRDALRFIKVYEHILNNFGPDAAERFKAVADELIEAEKQTAQGPHHGGEPCVLI